jgi:hypothetical protein
MDFNKIITGLIGFVAGYYIVAHYKRTGKFV